VKEKAAARQISEQALEILKSRVLERWLLEEKKANTIKFHGFNNGFDSETHAWITWQLSKRKP
jgi:hypothetical protein